MFGPKEEIATISRNGGFINKQTRRNITEDSNLQQYRWEIP